VIQYRKYIPLCWWAALVATTVASLAPNMGPPTTPIFEIGLDKFIHLATYLVLAVVPAVFFRSIPALAGVIFLVVALSVGIEFAQDQVPGRLFSLGDVVANLLGASLGTLTGLYFRRFVIVR